MIETAIAVAVLMLMYLAKNNIKSWLDEAEQDLEADSAESAVKRAERLQKVNKELEKLEAELGEGKKLVSAQAILDRAKGE